ncbi:MAG: imidazoleglycerol-phosphate dehydratase [Gemmatimonadales bacterium]
MSTPVRVTRRTRETDVRVEAAIGGGSATIETGLPFLDHMLTALAAFSGLDLTVTASGDLRHHVLEDVALTVGEAVRRVLPASCRRYGERTIPMDDALVQVVLDAGGRPYYRGPLPSSLYDHWMRSFSDAAGCTLHIRVLRGSDRHHVVEAAFKALGLALREAMVAGETGAGFSTKGKVDLEVG